jgi:glucokinase
VKVDTLVAVDVGASRTRVCVGTDPQEFPGREQPLIRDIRSVSALRRLLADVRAGIDSGGPVRLCAGVAAPPADDDTRLMTNWSEDRVLRLSELEALGFDEVRVLNDLEASAHGLVAFLDSSPIPGELVSFSDVPVPASGNRALVIPGSGLGSAGVIDLGRDAPKRWHVVSSEVGHVPASGTGKGILTAVQRRKGSTPSWEDCVSGPGLEALWVAMEPAHEDDPLSAPEIAYRASLGDHRCQQALHYYYYFAARFSQLLTLSYLSFGGLYLAGGSTRSNAPLISGAEFLTAFRDNDRMSEVLERIPVFLVLAEITLLGAWTAGWADLP